MAQSLRLWLVFLFTDYAADLQQNAAFEVAELGLCMARNTMDTFNDTGRRSSGAVENEM